MIIDISPPLDADIGLWPGDPRNTLHVGAHDFATGGAFASAMIAITPKGCDLIHRSPATPHS